MKENMEKIFILCVLSGFLLLGPIFIEPGVKGTDLKDNIGDLPDDEPFSDPSSSAIDGKRYQEGGANVGVYGYTNATKSDSISGDLSNWISDLGRGPWNRMGTDISIPKIGTGLQDWRLKNVDVSVSSLTDTFDAVPGGQFLASNWTDNGASLSMQNSQGTTQNLVYGSSVQAMNAIDSSYFSQGYGLGFDIGSFRETWTTSGSAGSTPSLQSENSPAATMSGWTALISDCNGNGNLGDHDHDGRYAQNTFTSVSAASHNNDGTKSGGEYSIWGELSTSRDNTLSGTYDSRDYAGDAGGEPIGIQGGISFEWSRTHTFQYKVEVPINWDWDGSTPGQNMEIDYEIKIDSSHNSATSAETYHQDWFNDHNCCNGGRTYERYFQNSYSTTAYAEIEAELHTPAGPSGYSDTSKRFGSGGSGSTSYVHYDWSIPGDVFNQAQYSGWSLVFYVDVSITNYLDLEWWGDGYTDDSEWPDCGVFTGDTYSEAWARLGYAQSRTFGVNLGNIGVQIDEESSWDNGQDNYVSFAHAEVPFDEREVISKPEIGFDWYVPQGVMGYKYPDVNEQNEVQLIEGEPFAIVHWDDGGTPGQSSPIFGDTDIPQARNQEIDDLDGEYQYLAGGGALSQEGCARFQVTWDSGLSTLDGVDSVWLEIGFMFPSGMTTDWSCGSIGSGSYSDHTLRIRNVSMTMETQPKADSPGLEMQLVWEQSDDDYSVFDLESTLGGTGYVNLDEGDGLGEYHESSNENEVWYFRIADTSKSAAFDYSMIFTWEYQYWDITTTWSVTSDGMSYFHAEMPIDVPSDSSFDVDKRYSDNFMFDLIFPRFQMEADGEPYWDLEYAVETAHIGEEKYGEENLADVGLNEIAVYENDTTTYASVIDSNYENYHQFARFRPGDTLYSGMTTMNWNVTFSAPNLISNVAAIKNSAVNEIFLTGDDVDVNGTFAYEMSYSPLADYGSASIYWYDFNEAVIGGPTNFNSAAINGKTNISAVGDVEVLSAWDPGEYYAVVNYSDADVCGAAGGGGANHYSSGIFRTGYNHTEFYVMTFSNDPILTYTGISDDDGDGVPELDTSTQPGPFEIELNWTDKEDDPIDDADVRITITGWERQETQKRTPILESGWINLPMIETEPGIYKVWVNATYLGHEFHDSGSVMPGWANMTWGFKNYTITCQKAGYFDQIVLGNFSIMYDTYMVINDPAHVSVEPIGATLAHPHFDSRNAFALDPFICGVQLLLNDSTSTPIDPSAGYFKESVRGNYTLYGYSLDPYDTIVETDLSDLLNWSYLNNEGSQYRKIVNGSLSAKTSSEMEFNVTWPSFGANMGPDYSENVHVFYKIAMWVDKNTTASQDSLAWMPDDVKTQESEHDYGTDFDGNLPDREELAIEEHLGFRVQLEGTANVTDITILNWEMDYSGDVNGEAVSPFDGPGGIYKPFDTITEDEQYKIRNYWYNSSFDRFRLRVQINQTRAAGGAYGVTTIPPCGPLNASTEHWGNSTAGWSGPGKVFLTGWGNGTNNITFFVDTENQWEMNYDWDDDFIAETIYGDTYYSPWLYFNSTTAGEELDLKVHFDKKGYQDTFEYVYLDLKNQETNVLSDDQSKVYDTTTNKLYIETPVGLQNWAIVRFNDTTNNYSSYVGVDGATIDCYEDNWDDRFRDDIGGESWTFTPLGDGRYNISILNTEDNAFSPDEYILKMTISKENYTTAYFNILLNVTKRQLDIQYVGGIDVGAYLPEYVSDYMDTADLELWQVGHINLTFKLVDLDNGSVDVPDINDPDDYFEFKRDNGDFYQTYITKFENASGIFYNVTFKTDYNILVGSNRTMRVSAWFKHNNRYYEDLVQHNITITPVETDLQMVSSVYVEKEYLWNSSTSYLDFCPHFQFNVTDVTHGMDIFGRNYPIEVSDMEIYSNYTNDNRNGPDSVEPGSANEDIFLKKMYGYHGGSIRYEYVDIYMDTRGVDVTGSNIVFNVTVLIQNYHNVTTTLTMHILNASTQFANNRISISTIDFHTDRENPPDWTATGLYSVSWDLWSSQTEQYTVPWGMILAVKVTYTTQTGALVIDSDSFGDVVQTLGFPDTFDELTAQFDNESGEYYYYFWAEIDETGSINDRFNISIWKQNYQPITWSVNITIRDRLTQLQYFQDYRLEQNITWGNSLKFRFEYIDLDASDAVDEGITNAVVNGSLPGTPCPEFTFDHPSYPNGLNASWTLDNIQSGEYEIELETDELIASNDPYLLHFNVTKLGGGVPHYSMKNFTLIMYVEQIELTIERFIVENGETLTTDTSYDDLNYGIDPEDYTSFTIYLRISYTFGGETIYIVDDSEISINATIYDWAGANYRIQNSSSHQYYREFTFETNAGHEGGGFWVATFPLDTTNIPGSGYPLEVHLSRLNGLIIDIVPADSNFAQEEIEYSVYIDRGAPYIPIWAWIIIGLASASLVAVGGYGVHKALQLRIPYVLRMIDESIDKISKDKFPSVGVMMGRSERVINMVIQYLDQCGIEWEITDKIELEATEEEDEMAGMPPLSKEEIAVELNKIESLSPDERMLFIEELLQLKRKEQVEFLESLKEE